VTNPRRPEDGVPETPSSVLSDWTQSAPAPAPALPRAFTPGTLLAHRYRIVALLGRGGMGEIYRAEDTKLGQTVALKFVRGALSGEALERLYSEVRIGRQVSHPNVCRLYDVAEYEGETFLTMEYVDGEDLRSLLSRIGRLPPDKARDIARDLCAGLVAVHDKSVVHRDLKPANVMVDGRGQARITDFGLAWPQGQAHQEGVAGTPAYMAPEQLAGKEPTVHTDLYALGLILFEMFTGRRFFDGRTLREISDQHKEPPSSRLASSGGSHLLDPGIERIVLACLEDDPAARPASARAVLAMLPGGDALEAALAAGETPSPDLVAAASKKGDLPVGTAWSLLVATLGGLALCAWLYDRGGQLGRENLPRTPEWLAERGRQVLARLGHEEGMDSAYSFAMDRAWLAHARRDASAEGLRRLRERAFAPYYSFCYRQSPRLLVAVNRDGVVRCADPPSEVSGMAQVVMDTRGRLTSFLAVPPQAEPGRTASWPEDELSVLLHEAGLDPGSLRAASPEWASPVDSDRKAAWLGKNPDEPAEEIRVEAAAYHGRPVWFAVLPSWSAPERMIERRLRDQSLPISGVFLPLLVFALPVGGTLIARRNLRLGRGDRKGAFRVALFVFATYAAARLLRTDHVRDFRDEVWILIKALAFPSLFALQVWLLYIALEPYARRRWPHILISWKRLLAGDVLDPLVGRDVLFGCASGILTLFLFLITMFSPGWLHLPSVIPEPLPNGETLTALRHVGFRLFVNQFSAVLFGLVYIFLLVLLRVLLRNTALAMAAWCLMSAAPLLGVSPVLEWGTGLLRAIVALLTLVRGGLLAWIVSCYVLFSLIEVPLTLDIGAWYAMRTLPIALVILGLALFGFRQSLAGKPALGWAFFED